MKGKVTLVGAGIGAADLMTIRGAKALENADVVVYDKLLGEGVMDMIPDSAEKINVGKQSANHTLPQCEINKLLVQKASEGKNVVRLKGGDSYMFGRGGEEAEVLYNNGIEFQVVPGITSAAAAPLFAGIPVTHRDYVSSVHIITGHGKDNKELDINFKACAEMGGTLVFLMGLKNLSLIAKGLIENGMPKNTLAAVIESGGMPNQKKVVAPISEISEKAATLKSPAVIVVGDVCKLSDKLDWFSKLPFKGKTFVITRPKHKAESLAEKLRNLGASITIKPCISTEIIDINAQDIITQIKKSDWVVFTSTVGVSSVFETLFKSNYDARVFGNVKIAAVGEKTKAELRKYGIIPQTVPKNQDGRSLAYSLMEEKADNILILRAEKGASDITDILGENNIKYSDMPVYRTVLYNDAKVQLPENADYVIFASPSEVKGFINNKMEYTGVCIGKKTAAEAEKHNIKYIIAAEPSDEGIINAVLQNSKGK